MYKCPAYIDQNEENTKNALKYFFSPLDFSSRFTPDHLGVAGMTRRDKTRVQMPAKMFPHLKLLCWLFMRSTLGFDTKQRNSFLFEFGVFLQQKQDSDNIIHS
jgi:hypothetical protein